jgi:hypothetical protein
VSKLADTNFMANTFADEQGFATRDQVLKTSRASLVLVPRRGPGISLNRSGETPETSLTPRVNAPDVNRGLQFEEWTELAMLL